MPRITVFHTSDMHNKLTPDIARALHDLKASTPGSLVFDSGDAIWSGNAYWRPGGEPVLDLMNSVPYDALCMGNREFHFMEMGVKAKVSRARFPILSANLRSSRSSTTYPLAPEDWLDAEFRNQPTRPCINISVEDVRVSVFGLTVPCITEKMLVKKVSDYYFEQPIAVAREMVPILRRNCDLLICLSHIGIRQDCELAESVPGIDLILGGHTHTITMEPERVEKTWILHHGFYVHYVGKVEINVRDGRIDVTNELISLAKA